MDEGKYATAKTTLQREILETWNNLKNKEKSLNIFLTYKERKIFQKCRKGVDRDEISSLNNEKFHLR